eukprot:6959689-Pyramimonas_sp.AAC.1
MEKHNCRHIAIQEWEERQRQDMGEFESSQCTAAGDASRALAESGAGKRAMAGGAEKGKAAIAKGAQRRALRAGAD